MKNLTLTRISKILIIAVFVTMCFGFMTMGNASAEGGEFTIKAVASGDGIYHIKIAKVPTGSYTYVELVKAVDGGEYASLDGNRYAYSSFKSGQYFVDSDVSFSSTYKYRAIIYNTDSNDNITDFLLSDELSAAGKNAKTPSFKTTKVTGETKIKLTWTKVEGAAGYKIYKYNTSTKKYVLKKTVSSGSTTSTTITGLPKNKKATFKIVSYNGSTMSPKSKAISDKTCPNAREFSIKTKVSSYPKGKLSSAYKKVWYNSNNKICVKVLFVNRTSDKVLKIKSYDLVVKHNGTKIAAQTFSKTLNLAKGGKKWVTFTFTKGTKKTGRNLRYGEISIPSVDYEYTYS